VEHKGTPPLLEQTYGSVERISGVIDQLVNGLTASQANNIYLKRFTAVTGNLKSVKQELQNTIDFFQEEDPFVINYSDFVSKQNMELILTITLNNCQFSTYSLYMEVLIHGGYYKVCEDMCWDRVWMQWTMKYAISMNDNSSQKYIDIYQQGHQHDEDYFPYHLETEIRKFYLKNLYAYEVAMRQKYSSTNNIF